MPNPFIAAEGGEGNHISKTGLLISVPGSFTLKIIDRIICKLTTGNDIVFILF